MNTDSPMPQAQQHIPVMCERAVNLLQVKPDSIVVDATFGRGGHSARIVQQLGEKGRLYGIDKDATAIASGRQLFSNDARVELWQCGFADLSKMLQEVGLLGEVDAILFDFGVSSPQLDEAQRGFSFMRDGPLDMRMNQTQGVTAYEWLCDVEEADLVRVLKRDGEERFAKRIARSIKEHIHEEKYNSTLALANLISAAMPRQKPQQIHPATRSFQAIRIAVNGELQEIEAVMPQVLEALKPGGRVVMMSFHSLEDRIVKRFFAKQSKGDELPPEVPVKAADIKPRLRLISKVVKADADEVAQNRRARSAVLRAAEKIW